MLLKTLVPLLVVSLAARAIITCSSMKLGSCNDNSIFPFLFYMQGDGDGEMEMVRRWTWLLQDRTKP